ncbi:diaminobutyrate--2-oxoglutarate transaminase family protein [Serratia rubidaea]|uniref:Diaminobutyrate--2-oxoglutarate aminotransferase n=1 Tax=Serratia rubidaea TaxID=61652 RepID=A0A3S4XA95_SERRU|nr:diaminobutyrate--2-oxoglutarate transaminase family protein [Serratia rubidaea]MEB7587197.1 diaminobutyrate--2-oxoglutarate transaminase family protein [Serratia rubidaea]VEI68984.1 Diaminobutyrate--2-oxoglutarate aminotransferase [Serratia rubidaea]
MIGEEKLAWLGQRESNARTYARNINRILARGELARVYDSDGREYIDCLACAGALPLGHNHPFVQEKAVAFLRSGQMQQALDIATPAKIHFVERLYRVLPEAFARQAKIQFCGPTGADAVEAALKLFKTVTGRRSVLVFSGAYHGMTHGTLSLMGNLAPKRHISGQSAEVQFLPYPYVYRSPFGADVSAEDTERLSLACLESTLADPESGVSKPAMVLLEAVQGEGGCIPASAAWLRRVREITERHDVPLVIDEVQTGIGRTGDMFAHQFAGIMPDALVLSKAIGGGYPLALLLYRECYDQWQPGAHAGTFRGNQIALVCGAATLEFIESEQVMAQVCKTGERLKQGLRALQSEFDCMGDVRGRGLMLGVELINRDLAPDALGHPQADGELAKRLKRCCLEAGLIVETGGRNGAVLRLLPPLIISEQDVDAILHGLRTALSAALHPRAAVQC